MAFNPAVTKNQVENVINCQIEMWREEPNAIAFRPQKAITFQQLNAISQLFGTDRIDVFAGDEGGYCDTCRWTELGEITVYKDAA